MNNYVQKGDVINLTAAAALTAGTAVVLGNSIAIPVTDIANGAVGAAAIEGVVSLPKLSTAVIAAGALLDWDVSAKEVIIASPATGDLVGFGIAVAAAGSGTGTVDVKLLPGNATVAS